MTDTRVVDKIIIGRVDPHIYAFTTETIPNYLKVGDTYRPVSVRLEEWREHYPRLKQKFEHVAKTANGKYFRDFAVHYYLEHIKHLHRLTPEEYPKEYYSKEFFKDAKPSDIDKAILDIEQYASIAEQKRYQFYSEDRLPEVPHWLPVEDYDLRPNQKETVNAFMRARKNGRKKLLMYAVMRFGKSFTSMCCALRMKAKVVLVVSAKADIHDEWKKTVESHVFFKKYTFLDSKSLLQDKKSITKELQKQKNVVVCLTLQDLMGTKVKSKHIDLFKQHIDLLIVDETHYGARAQEYGEILRESNLSSSEIKAELKNADKDLDCLNEGLQNIKKSLDVDMTLHLSGTPYRILMGGEFETEDIIAFYQFSHILADKEAWDREYLEQTNPKTGKLYEEWDNPYYGFPQMIRFAFNPSDSARKLIDKLKEQGKTAALNELFKPQSISKDKAGLYQKFTNGKEVLELLQVIDGSKTEKGLLSFLDYDKLKDGQMCHHIVFVLPFCASCDAMEILLKKNKKKFKNLSQYNVINIAGHNATSNNIDEIKRRISDFEEQGKKTISLTVNKMLTGCTIRQWDTMLFLKNVSSPQDYDQSIFRIQNQFIKKYKSGDSNLKYNMKPQTLLVDFDVNRMFRMQEQKALIYNINTEERGNNELEERLKKELKISPIIFFNKDKLKEATPTDIMDAVREYSASRSVMDEATDIPVDYGILNIDLIKQMLKEEADINARKGIEKAPTEGKKDDYDGIDDLSNTNLPNTQSAPSSPQPDEEEDSIDWSKKLATYYSRILFYSFLTDSKVCSLSDVLADIPKKKENDRIAKNVGLDYKVLTLFRRHVDPRALHILDYKIKNINEQSRDTSNEPLVRVEKALTRFGRLSVSEIVTPSWLAEEMVSQLPKQKMTCQTKFLDIASKEGEFACAIYKKFGEKVKNNIYSIPTSKLTYEFTLKVYKLLGMPLKNVIANFNSYDLINSENKEQYIQTLTNMEINVILGNPPYQETISKSEGNKGLGKQLFPHFMTLSYNLRPQYATLITPSRWFKGDAQDKSFLRLREHLIEEEHLRSIHHFPDYTDVFSNDVMIKGGVSYFLHQKGYSGNVDFYTSKHRTVTKQTRPLFEEGLDIVLGDSREYQLIQKVRKVNFQTLMSITTGRNAFGIIGKEDVISSISKPNKFKGSILLRCKNNEIRWTDEKYVVKNKEIAQNYKVFISKAAGDPAKDDKILTMPYLGNKNEVCTDSFIPIGSFRTKEEATNLLTYLKTKFVRYMVSILKVSQNVTQIVYRFVPLQDFTSASDIDWSKSVENIDKQLYKKYKLSKDEIAFIESKIKPM